MPVSLRKKPTELFPLGNTVMTRSVFNYVQGDPARVALILAILGRHSVGDWGDLDPEDTATNNNALRHGGRLLSAYNLPDCRLWIITEADRSVTTMLFPEDY